MKRTFSSICLAAAFALAQAQDMTPPQQVTDLKWMVGTWSGKGKFAFGGQEMDVSMTMVFSFDGQFLKSVSTNEMGGMKMSETMMLGWNPAKSEYDSYTFTSFAPTPGVKHGKMENGGLVMVSDPWDVGGMSVVSRTTLTKVSDTQFRMTMEFKNDDKWEKASDMELKKK